MVYRNTRTFPASGGFGTERVTVEAPELVRDSRRLLEGIGWHGVVQLDWRWSPDDPEARYLIEVNPRFWGGLFQSVQSGVDYPWLLYKLSLGLDLGEPPQVDIGTRTRLPVVSVLSQLSELTNEPELLDRLGQGVKRKLREVTGDSWYDSLASLFKGGSASRGSEQERRAREEQLASWLEGKGEGPTLEVLSRDDPMTVLGVLFALGHVLHHGRPPEELSREGLLEDPHGGD